MRRLTAVLLLATAACAGESSDRLPEGSPTVHLQLVATPVEGLTTVQFPLLAIDSYLVDEPGDVTTEPGEPKGGRWFPMPSEGGATLSNHVDASRPWSHGVRKVPESRVSQFRMKFRPDGQIRLEKADGTRCTIDPASVPPTAWQVSSPFRARAVRPGESWEFLVKVDLAKSLRPDGKGCFTIAPVLEVVRVKGNGVEQPLR